jgi:hypothetical protein
MATAIVIEFVVVVVAVAVAVANDVAADVTVRMVDDKSMVRKTKYSEWEP